MISASRVNGLQSPRSPSHIPASFKHKIKDDRKNSASLPSVPAIGFPASAGVDFVQMIDLVDDDDEDDEERDDGNEEEENDNMEDDEEQEEEEEDDEDEQREDDQRRNKEKEGRKVSSQSNEDDDSNDGTFYSAAKRSAEEWGTKHPDGRKVGVRKAQWSKAEISYIKKWCDDTLLEHPQWLHTIRSKCLKFILKDPKARPIFHPNHIINSRIDHGYNVAYGLN